MLGHSSLESLLKMNFELIQQYGYSKSELEEMPPWEWDIYMALVADYVFKQNEKMRKNHPELAE